MKKILFGLLFMALAFAGTACDSGSNDSAELNLSVSNIDFGDVRTGETETRSFTVTNEGNVAIRDLGVAVQGAAFSATPTTLELSVGASADIEVTFAPETDGDFSGTLTVASVEEAVASNVNLAGLAVDAIVGSWVSEGQNIAPGLAGAPFFNVRIDAVFNNDNTYNVVSEDANGSTITFNGTWQATAVNEEGIRGITLNQSEPAALVSSGIFRINGNSMEYEVIQEGLTGVEPPTQSGGFGSTTVGGNPTGPFWIQNYVRVD
ncbi:MAG: choice-of-anchor D domain-containing protein [Balneolales bacterium]|nr:choice-of-anchor D domain-containing protein [Balneolales bacterium]